MIKSLSIITVNRNNKHGLISTVKSVLNQKNNAVEFIIIDGASNDGSYEALLHYSDQIEYKNSEPDKGIYDAMNKGIANAKGTYLLFLNSGDILVQGALDTFLTQNNDKDVVYGDIYLEINNKLQAYHYPNTIDLSYLWQHSLPHQATIIKRNLFSEVGFYDSNLKIVADWAWFFKAIIIHKVSTHYINDYLAIYDTTGVSFNDGNNEMIAGEKAFVRNQLFPKSVCDYIDQSIIDKQKYSKLNQNLFFKIFRKCFIKS